MGIDRIPGVGPTNADIATAVAAPSAATIAAAVAAPSAATIAAAVAAPSAATIASTVNAPSAATIASTVAGSVPTLAQINTSVSNNASPYGGVWTNLGTTSFAGNTNTVTLSSLSSYKFLRFSGMLQASAPGDQWGAYFRINGDSGSNYAYTGSGTMGQGFYINSHQAQASIPLFLQIGGITDNSPTNFVLEIANAQAGAYKKITVYSTTNLGSGSGILRSEATWFSTAGISSVTFFTGSYNFTTGSKIYSAGAS